MKSKSIRYYFFTTITTVLVASVLVMGLVQTWLSVGYFRKEKAEMLGQVTAVIAEGVQSGQLDPAADNIYEVAYMAQVAGAVVFITGNDGTVIFSIGQNAPVRGAAVPASFLEEMNETGAHYETGSLGNTLPANFYVSGQPVYGPNGHLLGYVFAASDASAMRVYLLDTLSAFVLSAVLVLLVSSVLALVLTNRTVIPIRRLSGAARRFAEGDYSARVPVEGGDELAALSVTFNEMANSFEATDISRRSFMGNIAHELRTPMTTIKGFIDGMLDGTIPVDQRDRYLTVVSDEVGRLARLTRNMLDISRLEAGEYTPHNREFDIWGPLASVMIGAEQRLLDKNLSCNGMEHDAAAWVLADEDFVHQILFNLVDNAIKFAGEGGAITVRVAGGKGRVTVEIHNTGSVLEPDALQHVFDRFYKADKSRGVNARGAGLGLHISKVLLGLMGGRIWATSGEGEGTGFIFTLPAASPKKPPRGKRIRAGAGKES